MKIDATISISRDSNDIIRISVRDETSVNRFLEMELSPHDFAMAVTGLSEIKCNAVVRGLENVGKLKVSERRSAECPLGCHDRQALSLWLLENCKEEGWFIDAYLGSQGSVGRSEAGLQQLNYRVYKFVETESKS